VNGIITHPAKVTKVTGATVEVKILAESACASCRVRNKCGMGESREKLLVVETPEAPFFEEGEAVEVHTDQVMGLKAVFFAYMLPFLLVLTVDPFANRFPRSRGRNGFALHTRNILPGFVPVQVETVERDCF